MKTLMELSSVPGLPEGNLPALPTFKRTSESMGDVLGAALDQHWLTGLYMQGQMYSLPAEPGFKADDLMTEDLKPFASYLLTSTSTAEFRHREAILARSRQSQEILGANPILGMFGQALVLSADPANAVAPGLLMGIRGAASGALRIGTQQMLATSLQSTLQAATNPTYSREDFLFNVALGTVASGVVGGIYGAMARPLTLTLPEHNGAGWGNASAARSSDSFLGDSTPMPAGGVEKFPTSPMARLLNSTVAEAQTFAEVLFPTPWFAKKNMEGIASAPSVWADVKIKYEPLMYAAIEAADEAYWTSYRGKPAEAGFIRRAAYAGSDLVRGRDGKMSPLEFREKITEQLRSRKFDDPVEEVNAAARAKAKVYDEMKKDLGDIGFFSKEELDKPRVWHTTQGKIEEGYGGPMIWALDKLMSPEAGARFMARWDEWKKIHKDTTLTAGAALEAVRKNRAYAPIDEDMTGIASALRARELRVPASFFREFLVNDSEVLLRYYTRTAGTDLQIGRRFRKGDRPDISMREQIHAAMEQFARSIDDRLEASGKAKLTEGEGGERLGPATRAFRKYVEATDAVRKTTSKEYSDAMEAHDAAKTGKNPHYDAWKALKDPPPFEEWLTPRLRADFDAGMANARANLYAKATNAESRNTLDEMFQAERDMVDLRDALRGTLGQTQDPFSLTSRGIRMAKQVTAATVLSGALASAVDVGNLVLTFGMKNTFGKLFEQMRGGFRTFDLNKPEFRKMAVAMESASHSRALAMADLSDIHGRYSALERFVDSANSAAFTLNLISPWTDLMQKTAAILIQDQILLSAKKLIDGKALSKREVATLARSGIDEKSLRKIGAAAFGEVSSPPPVSAGKVRLYHGGAIDGSEASLWVTRNFNDAEGWASRSSDMKVWYVDIDETDPAIAQYAGDPKNGIAPVSRFEIPNDKAKSAKPFSSGGKAEKVDGVWIANLSDWQDKAAADKVRRAISEDVRRIIIEPHKGELPVWLSSEVGSVIGMFKGFAIAGANRVTIPALQMRDQQAMSGVLAMVAMGFAVDQIRHAQSDMGQVERPLTVQLGRAIERSGVLGYFPDVGRIADAITGNRVGYGAAIGEGARKPDPMDLLGPVASQAQRAGRIVMDGVSGNWDRNTARDARRMVPIVGSAAHFDWMADAIQQSMTPARQAGPDRVETLSGFRQ
jgi:hypothetical protein